MRLTGKKAIELCIEVWTWCAKTGKRKEYWPEWEKYDRIILNDCWFCEYVTQHNNGYVCSNDKGKALCLYHKNYGHCNINGTYYNYWYEAKTPRDRKKYAKLLLGQIKAIK